ncbi:hypothetical protein ACQP25_24345 [Microtetraspora malaysiensis]|uniref:hypothetical protein n=1 Tax=Microtetraspora malaysiensis TaxID=161358 RepID=UPI003D8EA658
MDIRSIIATIATTTVLMTGVPAATAQPGENPAARMLTAQTRAPAAGRWATLAGTSGKFRDSGRVRLLSYSLVFDAGQGHYGYLREGDRFVKTRYREAPVAPGERWAVGIPDYRLFIPVRRIDLIDRKNGRTHTVRMPARVTSPQWSPDGRTVLLTAYVPHSDGSLTIIGFVTVNVADRTARLVRTGPRHRVSDWAIGRDFRFYFTGDGRGVMAMHDGTDVAPDRTRIAVYDLGGTLRRFYTGVGTLDGSETVTPFSPSGRWFATFLGNSGDSGGEVGIVEAATGKVVSRFAGDIGAIAGWYDEEHLIVKRQRGRAHVYLRVDLSGAQALELIREKLIPGPAEYKPHLGRVDFVRQG